MPELHEYPRAPKRAIIRSSFNQAAPGANTNILAASISPVYAGTLRVTVNLATSSVFNYIITDGTTTLTCSFREGVPLAAGSTYSFDLDVDKLSQSGVKLSYNFRVATNSVINHLVVREMPIGV